MTRSTADDNLALTDNYYFLARAIVYRAALDLLMVRHARRCEPSLREWRATMTLDAGASFEERLARSRELHQPLLAWARKQYTLLRDETYIDERRSRALVALADDVGLLDVLRAARRMRLTERRARLLRRWSVVFGRAPLLDAVGRGGRRGSTRRGDY